MQSVKGYYDGTNIRPLEEMTVKPNQRVIITIMDEFIDPPLIAPKKGMRGILAQYADPELAEKEKGAWECAAAEKHDNI